MTNKLLPMPVYIQTQNFLLRSLTANDVTPEFVDWLKSDETALGLNVDTHNWNVDVFKKLLSQQYDNIAHYMIGIFDLKSQELIGFFSFDINYIHRVGYITSGLNSTKISPKVVLFETTDAVMNFFYEQRGVEKISARVLSNNLRILFCFIGNKTFELEATLKKECFSLKGERVDILIFSAFKKGIA